MVKIIYTVCGVGLGHASRSQPLIRELMKNHEVLVVSYGQAYEFLRKEFQKAEKLTWFKLIFADNKFKKTRTLMYNLPLLPYVAAKNFIKAVKIFREFKADIIISDFDVNGIYMAQLFRLPVVTISSMHLMNHHKINLSANQKLQYYLTEKPILDFFHSSNYFIIPSILKPKTNAEKTFFTYPVVRFNPNEFHSDKLEHILVYGDRLLIEGVLPLIKKFPGEKFVVYSREKCKKRAGAVFRKFSQEQFLKDLAHAKAVVSHGGISLISEASCLYKPMCLFPTKNFFERYYNARLVDEQGFGSVYEKPTYDSLKEFIENIPKYAHNLKKSSIKPDNNGVMSKINEIIRENTHPS